MTAELATAAGRFLVTYLLHSTLWLGGAWLVLRSVRGLGGDGRELVWKWAIVAAIVGAVAVSLLPVPHGGPRFVIASSPADERDVSQAAPSHQPGPAQPDSRSMADRSAEGAGRSDVRDPESSAAVGTPSAGEARLPRGLLPVIAMAAWLAVSACLLARVAIDALRLERLRRRSPLISAGSLAGWTQRLADRSGVRFELRRTSEGKSIGPLAAGVVHPVILVPGELLDGLEPDELRGLIAHELAHLVRRDPLWRLTTALACGLFWFQPLNWVARRRLAVEAEFLADRQAVDWVRNPVGLARCIATVLEWQLARGHRTAPPVVGVGIVDRRSTLVERVHALLESPARPTGWRWTTRLLLCAALLAVPLLAPRAAADSRPTSTPEGNRPMLETLTAITLAAGFAGADDPAPAPKPAPIAVRAAEESPKIEAVPASVRGFSGQIVGRVVSTDVEKGELVLGVQVVNRVWKNSTAARPKDLETRTVGVTGVFGKWLDVLLVVKPGDSVELEAKHVEGEKLKFLGENFRKVEAVAVRGIPRDGATEEADGFPAGLRGFRGILLGKVVSKDVEKGTLVFEMTGVKRVWKQNKAERPETAKGTKLTVNGIAGKWLDVLLTFEPGEAIEVEAFHNRGASLDFVQEWLRKAETGAAQD